MEKQEELRTDFEGLEPFNDADQNFRFFDLPVELRLEIISQVQLLRRSYTLKSLGATCKRMQALAEPFIFEHLRLEFTPSEKISSLNSSLIENEDETTLRRLTYVKKFTCATIPENSNITSRCHIKDVPSISQKLNNRYRGDWEAQRAAVKRTRIVNATAICLLRRILPGKLEEINWHMSTSRYVNVAIHSSLHRYLLRNQPQISSVLVKIPIGKLATQLTQLSEFKFLESLNLTVTLKSGYVGYFLNLLRQIQGTLEHLELSCRNTLLSVSQEFDESYNESLHTDFSGVPIVLKNLRSLSLGTDGEILIPLTRNGLIGRRQLQRLELYGDDTNISKVLYPGVEANLAVEDPHILELKELIINLDITDLQSQEIYQTTLELFVKTQTSLEELVINNGLPIFDLCCLNNSMETLRKFNLTFNDDEEFYLMDHLEQHFKPFKRLTRCSISSPLGSKTRQSDGTWFFKSNPNHPWPIEFWSG